MSFRISKAGFRATEVQKRCTIFFEGEWKNANVYDYCVIMVENSDEDIQVTFYLTDAHEMNWVTEFVDAPFFARGETEKLFSLVNSDRDVRGEKVGRFRVDFHRWQPRHAQILVCVQPSRQPSRIDPSVSGREIPIIETLKPPDSALTAPPERG